MTKGEPTFYIKSIVDTFTKKKKNKKIPLNLYRTYPQNKELTHSAKKNGNQENNILENFFLLTFWTFTQEGGKEFVWLRINNNIIQIKKWEKFTFIMAYDMLSWGLFYI